MLHKRGVLFFGFVLYKLALDFAYWKITSVDTAIYQFDFNALKYINGWVGCIIIFLCIPHKKNYASTCFLYFKFLLEIIPITVLYGMANENHIFYNILIASFSAVAIVVNCKKFVIQTTKKSANKLIILICVIVVISLCINLYRRNGWPTTLALNFDNVYELRGSGIFKISKYALYILRYAIFVMIPFLLTNALCKKKYIYIVFYASLTVCIYLYTGMKSYVFMLPLIVTATLWSARKEFYYEFFLSFSLGTSLIVLFYNCHGLINKIYSFFIRRVMFVSANNKFKYFDFFSKNPKMGMAGELPRWMIQINNPYPEGIGYIISEVYYNRPKMNSNTGFMVEGYMRFGVWGMALVFFIFAVLLLLIDNLQLKSSYQAAIGISIFNIFILSDGYLLTVVPWLLFIPLLLFYSERTANSGSYRRRLSLRSLHMKEKLR